MTKIINIDDAVVDTEKFRGYNSEAQQILDKIESLQTDFKILVETVAETTKVKKADLSGYFKAKHKAKIKEVTQKAATYEKLDSATSQ